MYRLVIHNFTEQDLNQNYTCSYGIFNERKGLTLKDGPFELQPSNESVHKTIQISDDSISVYLEMSKVYPMPSCTFSYEDANTTEYVKKSVEMVGSFFKVNFNYTITDKCEGKIMISCTIGSHLMNISQNCPVSGGDRQSRFSVIIIVGIVTCVGAMVFVFAAASCFVLYRRQRCGLGCRDRDSFDNCLRENDVIPTLEERQRIKEELKKKKHRKLILKTDQPTDYWLID
ncbi:unnamed protein product [Mytilus coruscus]|uniref:Uncharacterized protein n=1 Tax=Mytilus coruscus TaxID=42192 RepID=A0A6J8EAI4_MYTCO|nr:unnamed protein product [Mytilus coruscus]